MRILGCVYTLPLNSAGTLQMTLNMQDEVYDFQGEAKQGEDVIISST